MNSNLALENQNPPSRGAAPFLPYLVIFVAAIAYYAGYWHFWFNPHDEGGTVCLIAQRLMHGERPWVDVEPGYNIGWFYPLIGLFHFTGVNYLAARAWFFALSTVTALLGCGIVTRVTGKRWLGLITGLLLVLLPGSQFKNYIPLAEAANTACLIHLLYVDPNLRRKWLGSVILGGVVLGLTFLVRVELGYFFTTIWTLLLLIALFDRRHSVGARFASTILGLLSLVFGIILAQIPVYSTLRSQGLEKQYWEEYTEWFDFLDASFHQRFDHPKPAAPATAAATASATPPAAATPQPAAPPTQKAENGDREVLPRQPLSTVLRKGWRERILAVLTYAPLIGFAVFLIVGTVGFIIAIFRRDFALTAVPLEWLLLIGGSLTTFPQFFFFRPDRPHLSEFMPGYIIAAVASAWLLFPRGEKRPILQRVFATLVALFLAGQILLFAAFALDHPSGGTIAARFGRKARFQAENGVRVHTTKHEATILQGVYDIVMKFSKPDDYVICFPYMPGYNLMTNRRTYLRNVYVDNATRGQNWAQNTIEDFEQKQPAVIIIDDREINGTSASKFSHWAAPVYAYLKKHYTRAGKFDTVEIFVPPAAVESAPAPSSTPVPSAPAPAPEPATPPPATQPPSTPTAPATPVPASPASSPSVPPAAATPAPLATPAPSVPLPQ